MVVTGVVAEDDRWAVVGGVGAAAAAAADTALEGDKDATLELADKWRNELDRPLFCCNNRRARSTELSIDAAEGTDELEALFRSMDMAPKAALSGIKVGLC